MTSVPKRAATRCSRKLRRPTVTKDGVSVAKEIELKDKFENMGAQMVKEVASNTSDEAGDGTTTATVLAQAIVREGLKAVAAGANPMDMKRGIDKAVVAATEELKQALEALQGPRRSRRSARSRRTRDESIGKTIAEAMEGRQGRRDHGRGGHQPQNELDVVEGMQFDRGYLSPYFINSDQPDRRAREAVRPAVRQEDLEHPRDAAAARGHREGRPSAARGGRGRRGRGAGDAGRQQRSAASSKVAAVRPGFGDRRKAMLQDIAILTGGTVIAGSRPVAREGDAERPRGGQEDRRGEENTTIIDGAGKASEIKARIAQIKQQIEKPPPTTTRRSCRSACSRSSPAASP